VEVKRQVCYLCVGCGRTSPSNFNKPWAKSSCPDDWHEVTPKQQDLADVAWLPTSVWVHAETEGA